MLDFVLYTHTDCKDVWPIFFGQTKKYEENLNKFIFVNKKDADIPDDYKVILYDETKVYKERLIDCLNQIESNYVFFQHEDMFLYKNAQWDKINEYYEFAKDNQVDLVKFIRGGLKVGEKVEKYPHLRKMNKTFQYIFAIQPSLLKVDRLKEMLRKTPALNIWDLEVKAQKVCRDMDFKAYYLDDGGSKRGRYHWDSNTYPYIATAVVKGKWNNEYKKELSVLFSEYNIEPKNRGWK